MASLLGGRVPRAIATKFAFVTAPPAAWIVGGTRGYVGNKSQNVAKRKRKKLKINRNRINKARAADTRLEPKLWTARDFFGREGVEVNPFKIPELLSYEPDDDMRYPFMPSSMCYRRFEANKNAAQRYGEEPSSSSFLDETSAAAPSSQQQESTPPPRAVDVDQTPEEAAETERLVAQLRDSLVGAQADMAEFPDNTDALDEELKKDL